MIINFVLHMFHYLSNITPKFRVIVFVCNVVSNLTMCVVACLTTMACQLTLSKGEVNEDSTCFIYCCMLFVC